MGAIWQDCQCQCQREGPKGGGPRETAAKAEQAKSLESPGTWEESKQRIHTATHWQSGDTPGRIETRLVRGAATPLLPYDVATNSPPYPRSLFHPKNCIIHQWIVPKDNPPRPISVNPDGILRPPASLTPPPGSRDLELLLGRPPPWDSATSTAGPWIHHWGGQLSPATSSSPSIPALPAAASQGTAWVTDQSEICTCGPFLEHLKPKPPRLNFCRVPGTLVIKPCSFGPGCIDVSLARIYQAQHRPPTVYPYD